MQVAHMADDCQLGEAVATDEHRGKHDCRSLNAKRSRPCRQIVDKLLTEDNTNYVDVWRDVKPEAQETKTRTGARSITVFLGRLRSHQRTRTESHACFLFYRKKRGNCWRGWQRREHTTGAANDDARVQVDQLRRRKHHGRATGFRSPDSNYYFVIGFWRHAACLPLTQQFTDLFAVFSLVVGSALRG